MSPKTIVHDTFTLERSYPVSPQRVFAAWADPEVKARWFIGPESWRLLKRELDFRVGGHELLHGRFADGAETIFSARYHDIVQERRLIYAYDMRYGGQHLSVSLTTVEFQPVGDGTRLRVTEQGAFLDGDPASATSRQRGTAAHLERIGQVLLAPQERQAPGPRAG